MTDKRVRERIAITLKPEAREAVKAYAAALGKPVAGSISDLLVEILPHIHKLTAAHLKAKELPEKPLAELHSSLTEAEFKADQADLPLEPVKAKKKRATP